MSGISKVRRDKLRERVNREIRECGSDQTIVTATDKLKCGELLALLNAYDQLEQAQGKNVKQEE